MVPAVAFGLFTKQAGYLVAFIVPESLLYSVPVVTRGACYVFPTELFREERVQGPQAPAEELESEKLSNRPFKLQFC